MERDGEQTDPWGAPGDIRAMGAEMLGSLAQPAPEQTNGPARRRSGGRRQIWRLLRPMLYVAVAAGVFAGGWSAHAAFRGGSSPSSTDELTEALVPQDGLTLDVQWGDVPVRLVQQGVVDLQKFEVAARSAGFPLTSDQLDVLEQGSDYPLQVDSNNAYFILDVLWALGLANSNAILTQGAIAQYERPGDLASTGGWTIGAKPGEQYLAALELIKLTPQQQDVVEEVVAHAYRPCCANMAAFPDCNHGMAALGLAELMASQGASADDIFSALKKISPFWFPAQYHHLGLYFQGQGQQWDQVDARTVMGAEYSSASGWKQVAASLQQQGVLTGGSGGSKASGCSP